MRRTGALLAALALLAACGQNPLLKTAASDFQPIRVGSQWSYRDAAGKAYLREVTGTIATQGRDAFVVTQQAGTQTAGVAWWSFQNGALEVWNGASNRWDLTRRLPYTAGNRWDLPSSDPLASWATVYVEALDRAETPAGVFEGCWRLKTKTWTYSAGTGLTTLAESLVWAAPGIGDVRFASIDVSGTANMDLELTSYRIPR